MNDDDRDQWIENDEALYLSWKASKMSKRAYIRAFRKNLDAYINKQLNEEPAR